DRTVLSDHDLQVAQIGEARTKAVWRRAQAELAEARLALQQSRVTAPFTGVILGVDAYPGQALVNGLKVQTLVELADGKRLIAKARVTAEQIGHLNKESSVQVDIAGRQVTAKVEYLALEPSLGVSTDIPLYDLKVIFNRPDDMVVRVGLPVVIRAE
ncbi:MAG: HlyD family efflux transporter periplasmic adaptor subunit, partial [Chromatiales bacterium]|nr:HlyD family efflux transporter periplasmic adaptor subunit [Chromatiales bacterium]